ncbi:MAG: ATP-binding cassette domain-containing protein [Bifidobacteriaceae bacterium]|jgi:macrolide transport system ATP-binding/permease protein|nr:ATP-binding cassette domain-containing protein [Bifidobacteriaceae bacterium]
MALRDATGQIDAGEFVAVVGASGSGKTTLLSLLGLLDQPTSGEYWLAGIDVRSLSERQRNALRARRFGFVFQNSYLIGTETVADNVDLGLRVRGVPRSERHARTREALERVGLLDHIDRRAAALSGGEKQRVAVARALVSGPDVILADEPTGALDSVSTRQLVELLQAVNRSGTTVVVVTHDPLVAAAAGRRLEIQDGILSGPAPVPSRAPTPDSPKTGDANAPNDLGSRIRRIAQEVADAALAPLNRPLRTALVGLAYTLGIASLVAAMGITGATSAQIVTRLTSAGSQEIRITDTGATQPDAALAEGQADGLGASGASTGLAQIEAIWSDADRKADALGELEGVAAAAPVRTFTAVNNTVTRLRQDSNDGTAASDQATYQGHLVITDRRYLDALSLTAGSGNIDLLANTWHAPLVVAGAGAAADLHIESTAPGTAIWVNGRQIDVVAILEPEGDAVLDRTLYFSPPTLAILTDQLESYWLVRTEPGYAEPLAQAVPYVLAPDNPAQIAVSKVAELASLQQDIGSDLGRLLGLVGAIVLALSVMTSATTMFLSVQQRGPEIALRRAMGASRSSIWRIFTYEGTLIGLAGGAIGAALGVAVAALVVGANRWPLAIGPHVVVTAMVAGITAGAFASIIPALAAARRAPAALLRTV